MLLDDATTGNGRAATSALPEIVPQLLNVAQAAALCGQSESGWRNLNAEGRVPAPIRLRGLRWPRAELEAWIAAGCPDRLAWEAKRRAAI